jgi:hypothetical protein
MPTARKRSARKARTGTAGKRKTAQRKSPSTKARTRSRKSSAGRVKGARGGPAHEHPEPKPKRELSKVRAAEAGEPISGKRGSGSRIKPSDITDADIKKIPGLARARMRDEGEDSS